jgi:hypothetical protein
MIRITDAREVITGEKTYFEYAGLSTDTKPSGNNISTGSLFMEVDTGDIYAFDEDSSEWNKVCALGGDS